MKWVSLHHHTTCSHGDGFGPVRSHVKRGHELGMSALAVTEHRNVSSHVDLEIACAEFGMKPIYGIEFDVALEGEKLRRHFHQTVLAMDEEGYRSLNHLVTLSFQQAKYVPRLYTEQLLDPKLTRGLIVTSGCADSYLSCTLLGGKSLGEKNLVPDENSLRNTRILAERYRDVYGDRYYLEVQLFPELDRSTLLNQTFADLSARTGIPLVATADVHYPHPDDNGMQRILHGVTRNKNIEEADAGWEYDIRLTFPESDQIVIDRLMEQELTEDEAFHALRNTALIADRCNVELPKSPKMRHKATEQIVASVEAVEMDPDVVSRSMLQELIERGIDYRLETNPAFAKRYWADEQGYLDRIAHEFKIIDDKGFWDYFLIVADLITFAKDHPEPIGVGPGRGSAAGSLMCYVIRITEIDPLQFPLMKFERFIDPTRPDWPDIDIDFEDVRRQEIFAYAREVYGEENIGNIVNNVRYRGRSAIDAIGRVYEIPFEYTNKIKDMVVDRPDGHPRENDSLEDLFESIDAFTPADPKDPRAIAKEALELYPGLRLACRLEGNYSGFNVHAAGMVISNLKIEETCAIYQGEEDGAIRTIPYDKEGAEYLGMIKIDVLGLATMGMMADVVRWTDVTWEQLYALEFDDQEVLQAFARGDLTGIFQFDGGTTRSIVEKVFATPRETVDFLTLADINALSRPGSLISGMTAQYQKIERDEAEPRDYGYDSVNAIMASTNGCLVYQEQVMAMGSEVAGMPGEKVGALRRVIGKKKAGGAFEKFYDEFRAGAVKNGLKEEDARELWEFMATSSSYLFNIAHAVSYAVIAYWAMWLKIHHPVEFYAGSLRRADKEHALKLMQDAARHGKRVRPPKLSVSDAQWRPWNGQILAGFDAVDGCGPTLANNIVEWRDQWIADVEVDLGRKPKGTIHLARLDFGGWKQLKYRPGKKGRKTLPDEPSSGVPKFGDAKVKAFEAMDGEDPFGIFTASNLVDKIREAIATGEVGLPEPTCSSSDLSELTDLQVIWVGMVKEIKIIDAFAAMAKRDPSKTVDEIKAESRDPEKDTRAKLICVDADGLDVQINIHRFLYPSLAQEISEMTPGLTAVHVVGTARDGFGLAIQADNVVPIEEE